MTNCWQLFISAGLPSVMVLVSMWRSDKRMDTVGARLNRMDGRFDRSDAWLNSVESELGGKIESVRTELNARIDRVADDQKQF